MIMLPWNKKQSVPITPVIWRKLLGKQWCIEANWKQNIENNQRILTPSVSENTENFCSKVYKIERQKYYSNLDLAQFTDNKTFWQNMEPFFSEKK